MCRSVTLSIFVGEYWCVAIISNVSCVIYDFRLVRTNKYVAVGRHALAAPAHTFTSADAGAFHPLALLHNSSMGPAKRFKHRTHTFTMVKNNFRYIPTALF